MSRSARVARNVGWSLLGQGGIAAANLLLLPRIVHGFGEERYGLYVLMFAAANYVSIFTFGAGTATVNFVAERHGAGDGRGTRDALAYGGLLHLGGAALGAALLWAAAPWAITAFFRVPPALAVPGIAVLRAAAVGAVLASGAQWTQVSLQGFQRFDWNGVSSFLQGALTPLGVVALLYHGKGLRAAGWWYALVNALTFALSAVVLARALPRETRAPGGRGLAWSRFLGYGLGAWLGPIAWIVANQLDKVFIARVLALSSLTLYAVPSAVLQRLQVIPGSVSSVILPVISGASGASADAAEDVRRMYLRSTRLLTGLMAPAYALLFVLMPQFLSLWLGGRFGGESVWPARLLVAAYAIGVLAYTANPVAAARGRIWWVSAVAWLQAGASLALWPWLIPRYGILGAAAASLVAQGVPCLLFVGAVNRLLRVSAGRYAREALGPTLAASAALLAVVFPPHRLAGSWASLAGLGLAGGAVYAAVLWLGLPDLDRGFARRWRPWA